MYARARVYVCEGFSLCPLRDTRVCVLYRLLAKSNSPLSRPLACFPSRPARPAPLASSRGSGGLSLSFDSPKFSGLLRYCRRRFCCCCCLGTYGNYCSPPRARVCACRGAKAGFRNRAPDLNPPPLCGSDETDCAWIYMCTSAFGLRLCVRARAREPDINLIGLPITFLM